MLSSDCKLVKYNFGKELLLLAVKKNNKLKAGSDQSGVTNFNVIHARSSNC